MPLLGCADQFGKKILIMRKMRLIKMAHYFVSIFLVFKTTKDRRRFCPCREQKKKKNQPHDMWSIILHFRCVAAAVVPLFAGSSSDDGSSSHHNATCQFPNMRGEGKEEEEEEEASIRGFYIGMHSTPPTPALKQPLIIITMWERALRINDRKNSFIFRRSRHS